MMSNPCQNQGFVLEGYPKTTKQAKALFGTAADVEEEAVEEEEEGLSYNKKTMPEYVISLNAPDDVLYSRIMDLPEKEIQGTNYTEENMIRRVTKFRESNTDDETVLNYFDELEVHPFLINVADDEYSLMEYTFKIIINKIGAPRNYGDEGEDEYSKRARLIEEEKARVEEERRKEAEKKAYKEQESKMEEWANLLDSLKQEEEQLFAIQGIPVRHYLMRYILPTLTRGLLEVARVRPDDPVNYLAEYLFHENPEGKMLQPEYTEAAEELVNASQQFQDSLIKFEACFNTEHDFYSSRNQNIDSSQISDKPQDLSQESGNLQPQQLFSVQDEESRKQDCFSEGFDEEAE
ncbi:hypothetical protein L9F63_010103 [Diploptera punctata]|uniref:Adenylate kinase 7 n=1 Tax=Diploptera punctata TaxID=6984 RepID=A0AAD8ERT9_DIPPU|nr:hypothetical protein L9F63_010103 [Diploptera punctata]